MNKKAIWIGIPLVMLLATAGLWWYWNYLAPPSLPEITPTGAAAETQTATVISAEGKVLPAHQVTLAFSQAGRVAQVFVVEGEEVQAGQPLMRLDNQLQEIAVHQAQAARHLAEVNLEWARSQYEEVLAAAVLQAASARAQAWQAPQPREIEQPVWYFERNLELEAAKNSLEAARQALEAEKTILHNVLNNVASAGLIAAEERLAQAQSDFLIADEVLSKAKQTRDEDLIEQAEELWEQARDELEAAQSQYEQMLTTQAAQEVLEARARLALAQERYDRAQERYYRLLQGEESLAVKSARQAVQQAEAVLEQAEAALQAARVALDQTTLYAPMDGSVVAVWLEPGEMAAPTQAAILLADVHHWVVETSDLSEVDVVLLQVGMPAVVSVDAFPGQSFTAYIEKISLMGTEQRGEVTYTIRLIIDAQQAPLRWGMTAFVEFTLQ